MHNLSPAIYNLPPAKSNKGKSGSTLSCLRASKRDGVPLLIILPSLLKGEGDTGVRFINNLKISFTARTGYAIIF